MSVKVKTKAKKATKSPTRKTTQLLSKRWDKISDDMQSRGSKTVAYFGTKEGKSVVLKTAIGVAIAAAAGVGLMMAARYLKKRAALQVPDIETKEGSPSAESPLKSLPHSAPSKKVFDEARERGSDQRRRDALKQAQHRTNSGSLKVNNRANYNRTAHT